MMHLPRPTRQAIRGCRAKLEAETPCSCQDHVGIDGDVAATGMVLGGGASAPKQLSSRDLLCGMWPAAVPFGLQTGEMGSGDNIKLLVASICEPLHLNPDLSIASRTTVTLVDSPPVGVKVSPRR